MPGKHAPATSRSFLISLGTAIGGALVALAVVVGIAVVVLNAGSEKPLPTSTIGQRSGLPSSSPNSSPVASSSPSVTSSPAVTSSPNTPARTTLRVLNGTTTLGLAKKMAARAKAAGYPDPKLGNTKKPIPQSTVYYRADSKAEAEAFAQRFSEFTQIAPAPSSFAADVMLTAIVGEDYPGATGASPSPTPTASPSH